MKKHLTLIAFLSIGFGINSYSQTNTSNLPSTVRAIENSENNIQPNRERMIENKVKSKEITIVESDSTFPKYIDTGNAEIDQANYAKRKAEWIKNN